ncbi:hypothetical protein [Rhodococcus erythropolis]|uniref:hypothetical protein n=1 Tax=Rhodococcus erythropolis TaxID=1833 RepID=UPI00083FA43A|nr:hypothetical protein [Rhodococcus erythropolis]
MAEPSSVLLDSGPSSVPDTSAPSPSEEIGDFDAYVDIFRRLRSPFYEKARRRFDDSEVQEQFHDATPEYPYWPENLETIAKGLD